MRLIPMSTSGLGLGNMAASTSSHCLGPPPLRGDDDGGGEGEAAAAAGAMAAGPAWVEDMAVARVRRAWGAFDAVVGWAGPTERQRRKTGRRAARPGVGRRKRRMARVESLQVQGIVEVHAWRRSTVCACFFCCQLPGGWCTAWHSTAAACCVRRVAPLPTSRGRAPGLPSVTLASTSAHTHSSSH